MFLGGKVNLIPCTQGWDIDGKVEPMISLVTGLNSQKIMVPEWVIIGWGSLRLNHILMEVGSIVMVWLS